MRAQTRRLITQGTELYAHAHLKIILRQLLIDQLEIMLSLWSCFFYCRGKQHYEVKWFVPLWEVQLSDKMDDTPVEWKQRVAKAEKEIQAMKSKLKDLKAQLRKSIKECKEV